MSKVSVVIPMYNSEKTIEQVLGSVISQTAISEIAEIIVVDDGSTDSSALLVEEFIRTHPTSSILLIRQPNGGVSSARNHGIRIAKGEYIALLDSDDLWMPQKIERQLQILNNNPEIVFLGSAYYLGLKKQAVKLTLPWRKTDRLFNATLTDIYFKHFPTTPSVIFKRSAVDTVGYFDENQKYGEDINYFQKFCIYFNYYYLPECLVHIAYNKAYTGSEGLSSNYKKMHQGTLINLRQLHADGHFGSIKYLCFRILFELKYWRRILIRFIDKFQYNRHCN